MKDFTNGVLQEELRKAEEENNPTLKQCLDRLKRVEENLECETNITIDFAPRSFFFARMRNNTFIGNGGIIYHGPHDNGGNGGAPTFSVSLSEDRSARWEIHT